MNPAAPWIREFRISGARAWTNGRRAVGGAPAGIDVLEIVSGSSTRPR
jgi:hypothetical protein